MVRDVEIGSPSVTQLGRSLELRDGIKFLECGGKRVGETPGRSRPELLVLGLEVKIMHGASEVFRRFQLALHKRLVDDHLRRNIGEFASLPRLHLFSHWLEVALHPVDTNRDAVDQ